IEWALDLNAVQVEKNQQAFRLGRKYVADARLTHQVTSAVKPRAERGGDAITSIVRAAPDSRLAGIIARLVDELIAYQSPAYARRYAQEVERVRAAEASALDVVGDIAEQYARQLFKVMAYKDEYEVARLQLDPAFEARL